MINSYILKIDDSVKNKLEAEFYETETAARNAAIALSRVNIATGADPFTSAFAFQWDRLVKHAKEYEYLKDDLSNNVVIPDITNKGIKANVSWNLDFQTGDLNVSYDANEELKESDTIATITCDSKLVDEVSSASYILNAYDAIIGYIGRNNGAGIAPTVIDELISKQSEAYKTYMTAKDNIENTVVVPYLQENGIDDKINWELKYSTGEIKITK